MRRLRPQFKSKETEMKGWLRRVIDVACIALTSSVVMDSYLWVTGRHWIPSWTMAAMSLGVIILLQVIKVIKKGG